MVAKPDSKSGAREGVWVRVPPSVQFFFCLTFKEDIHAKEYYQC